MRKLVIMGFALVTLCGYAHAQDVGFDTNYVWFSFDESGYPPVQLDSVAQGDTITLHLFAKPDTFAVAGIVIPICYDTSFFELVEAAIDSSSFENWMFIGVNDTVVEYDTLHPDSTVGKILWYAVVAVPPAETIPAHNLIHIGYCTFYVKETPSAAQSLIDTCWYHPTNHLGFSNPAGTCEFVPNWMAPVFVGVEEKEVQTYTLALKCASPNPFRNSTLISFSLPAAKNVELVIYNAAGQRIRTLYRGTLRAGVYTKTWDGRDDFGNTVPSGTYFCTLKVDGKELTKKLTLLK